MNILPIEQQTRVIGALVEGNSIRSVERMTGIHRDTIMRLGDQGTDRPDNPAAADHDAAGDAAAQVASD